MRFQIGERVYDATAIEDLSLKMLLELEAETERFGRVLRMNDLRRITTELDALPSDAARGEHPDAPWLTAVSIWATRRLSGEALSFDAAIDFPLKQLVFLPDPSDRKVASDPKARKAAGTGSARAAAKRTRNKPTKQTSGQQSSGA